jgi:hypothetical protein
MDKIEFPEFNKYQSVLHDKLLEPLDRASKTDFFNYIQEIEFIKNLTSKVRQRAGDLPRDKEGKIIVDITNLHILENMKYFTERADFFRKNGTYTDLYPNFAPGSEYRKFWDEERRRCKDGYIRESDGEWIPGYYYFYLNYCPILKVEELFDEDNRIVVDVSQTIEDLEVGIRVDRIEDFPSVWDGDYQFFHYVEQAEVEGRHGSVLKTRGRGYSFKGGSMLSRNYFLIKSSKSYAFANETEYLTRDGILTKAWSNLNFIDNHTPWTQPRDYTDREMHKKASYRDVEKKIERGFMSEILGVTCKSDPDKGRGKRGKLLFFDESGKFPQLIKTWQIARKSVEQGRYVYGFMVTAGTGGVEGADFEAAEAFFYYPEGYNIKALKNVWDITKVESKCALFIPEYLNRQGCYDSNGNSDVIKALVEILIQRQKVRVNSSDPATLIQEKAEAAITPQDSVLRTEGNIFPIQDLKDRLAEISVNVIKFTSSHYVGRLAVTQDGSVKFVISEEQHPIRDYPLKDNLNKHGAIEIYEHPKPLADGFIPKFRYIAGIDSYDDDHSTTNSLGSIFILDRYTDRIVAEYTGRPSTATEFYEICLRLLKYYNALANYEAHPYSQKVKTPDGTTKLWGDIKIGDTLFAPNGKIVKVIDIPIDEYMPIYKMKLCDGREIMCSDNHIWSLYKLNEHPHELKNYTTKEIIQIGTQNKFKQNNFFIPNSKSVNYNEVELPIDPYTMGLSISEGCIRGSHCTKNQVQISSGIKDMEFYRTVVPYEIKYIGKKGSNWSFVITDCKKIFKKLGLLNSRSETKFIPDIYLYNSYANRLELLKGLMDGDGHATKNGSPVYVTSSEQLANDFMSLCRSLGFNCKVTKNRTTSLYSYKVVIYTSEVIFKLPRKKIRQYKHSINSRGSKATAYLNKTGIKSIEFSHYEMGKCVTVDSSDGRYLIGDYVVTHNCDKKGLYGYFYNKNCLHYLCDNPEILSEKDLANIKNNYGNKKKGTNSGTQVNAWGRRLQADWLTSNAYGTGGHDDEGNPVPPLMNLQMIRTIGYIKELIAWHPDLNADRVSAMGMLMILRADLEKLEVRISEKKVKGIFDDPFFKRTGKTLSSYSYVN